MIGYLGAIKATLLDVSVREQQSSVLEMKHAVVLLRYELLDDWLRLR